METADTLLPANTIIVCDTAASTSGALSVLRDFHFSVMNYPDKSIRWIFIIGTPTLEEAENVKVIRLPWVKKNWLNRLFFDTFIAPKIVKREKADKILSLQNIAMPFVKIPQIIYLHLSIPFSKHRFPLFEDKKMWVYPNILSNLICWMTDAVVEKTGVCGDKIIVIPPVVNIEPKCRFTFSKTDLPTFIYPAVPFAYKNHEVILRACSLLNEAGITEYRVVFTLDGTENKLSAALKSESEKQDLPIEFIGTVTREKLFEWYSKAVLLFPSYIETFGMPILEAKMHGAPVIAADMPFSREILQDHADKAFFFEYNRPEELAKLMQSRIRLQ